MKKLLFLCLVAFSCAFSYAQNPLSHSEVISAEGKTAKQLYKDVKKWFALTFVSAQDVIQYDDGDNEITGKAVIPYECKSMTWASSSGFIRYTVIVKVKDGRLKLTCENFIHQSTALKWADKWSNGIVYEKPLSDDELKAIGQGGLKKKQYRAIDERVRPLVLDQIATLVASLTTYVNQSGKEEEDDW